MGNSYSYFSKFEMLICDEIVSLNVGGKLFQTTRSTLKTFPESFFGLMFSDNQFQPSIKDKDGNWFIDRSYEHFDEILSFFRKGKIPEHVNDKLKDEIKFYFPGYYVPSELDQQVKQFAKKLYQYWISDDDSLNDDLLEIAIPFPYPVSGTNGADLKRHYDYTDRTEAISAIAELVDSILKRRHPEAMSGKWLETDRSDRNVDMLQDDEDALNEFCDVWGRVVHFFFQTMSGTDFIEKTCHKLQKLVGEDYVVEWEKREHICSENPSEVAGWSTVVFKNGYVYDDIPCMISPASLFSDFFHSDERNLLTPACCKCKGTSTWHEDYRSFVYIYKNTRYKATLLKKQKT